MFVHGRQARRRAHLLLPAFAVLLSAGVAAGAARAAGTVTSADATRYLNEQRADNGIPAGIVDNPAWDTGCADHLVWEEENPSAANPHQETSGSPGYTPDGAAAGNNSVLAVGADWAQSPAYPWDEVNPWEMAPIHLMQLLSPDLSSTGWADDGTDICMISWGGFKRPSPAAPQLLTYPGAGTNFIYPSEVAAEWPFTPGDFVGLPDGTTTGPYLFVFGYGTGRGAITAASLTGPTGPVEVKTVDDTTTGADGDLGAYLPAGGMIIPVSPLVPGATYRASVTFAPNDIDWNDINYAPGPTAPLSVNWSFQVASGIPALNAIFGPSGLSATSSIPRPVGVLVARLPSDTIVGRFMLDPNGTTLPFALPGARYEACFVQAPSAPPAPPGTRCKFAVWRTTPRVTLGTAALSRGQLTLPLKVTSTLAGVAARVTLAQIPAHCTPRCAGPPPVFYRRTIKLAALQTLRLPARKLELLTVSTPRTDNGDYLFAARMVTMTLHG
jgi:hypothetical protein